MRIVLCVVAALLLSGCATMNDLEREGARMQRPRVIVVPSNRPRFVEPRRRNVIVIQQKGKRWGQRNWR